MPNETHSQAAGNEPTNSVARWRLSDVGKWLVIGVPLLISAASVLIAYVQVRDAREKAREEIASKERELNTLQTQHDRDWNFKALDFVANHAEVIFGPESPPQTQIIDAMKVAFPQEIAEVLLPKLRAANPYEKAKEQYEKAEKFVSKIGVTVRVEFTPSQKAKLQALVDALNEAGYSSVLPHAVDTGPNEPDVRYYHDIDKGYAEEIKSILSEKNKITVKVNRRADNETSVSHHPEGTIEIWLT